MLLRRYGSFAGGIELPEEKQATLDSPIQAWRDCRRLLVPLAPCGGPAARPLVKPGQYVSFGEKIAVGEDGALDVFSPAAGRVAGFATTEIAHGDGFAACAAIELEEVSAPAEIAPVLPTYDWREASPQALRQRLAEGGLATFRRLPKPLAAWIEAARRSKVRSLVANVLEHQPYVTAQHRLLVDFGAEVIRGLAILARAIEAQDVVLAVDQRRTEDYRELVGPARMYHITRVALPNKYPIEADAMLLKVLTRREAPLGGSPLDLGVAVIDAATCFAAYRWAACAIPPTGRVVTVAGPRTTRQGNFFVPFGVRCKDLTHPAADPILHGGTMVGLRCTDGAVVGPASNCVLAVSTVPAPLPGPCIRCGWCTDHCPARLNVASLNDHYELGQLDRSRRAGVAACVECGVCSYICPARLPLSQRVKQLKRLLRPVPAASSEDRIEAPEP